MIIIKNTKENTKEYNNLIDSYYDEILKKENY